MKRKKEQVGENEGGERREEGREREEKINRRKKG